MLDAQSGGELLQTLAGKSLIPPREVYRVNNCLFPRSFRPCEKPRLTVSWPFLFKESQMRKTVCNRWAVGSKGSNFGIHLN
jgi:hypothetical protein